MARPSERKIRGETAIAQTLQFLGVEFTGRFEEANSTLSRPFVVKKYAILLKRSFHSLEIPMPRLLVTSHGSSGPHSPSKRKI